MAPKPMTSYELLVGAEMMAELNTHLFPGDGDEHGAVIGATVVETARGLRLLARTLVCAQDGIDYVPGKRGYRMLTASFVAEQIAACARDELGYFAVHCHGGDDYVAFSGPDLASHERGYPALIDIAEGGLVGGFVFARNAVAGDIWLPDPSETPKRVELSQARVVGRPFRHLYSKPPPKPPGDPPYDRQVRLFGDRGQADLNILKVGVIGAGGAGSLITEYLARLGVGHLVVIDPERIEPSNLPRVVGSRGWDAQIWLVDERRPAFLRWLGGRLATHKVAIARRVARQANPKINFDAIVGDVTDEATAQKLTDCDYLFLAADSTQARLVFNALVHQYLIPGIQVGAKVQTDRATGEVIDVFSVVRPVTPDRGCLSCNGLISSARLQEEALTPEQRRGQRYVDDDDVIAPSVITLNAVAAAHAVDDFLFTITGLLKPTAPQRWLRFRPQASDVEFDLPRRDPNCSECGVGPRSRRARGGTRRLPTKNRTGAGS
jgi:molybdopterin/thiamine biosynthesis adenylyltransferase